MTIGLAIACVALFCLLMAFVFLYVKSKRDCARLHTELKRYRDITDLEKHASDQRAKAEAALAEAAGAQASLEQLNERIAAQSTTLASQESEIAVQEGHLATAATALGEYKTLEELREQNEKQKRLANQYNALLGNFKTAEALKTHISEQQTRIQQLEQTIGKFESLQELDRQIAVQKVQIKVLESRIQELNEVFGGADTVAALQRSRLKKRWRCRNSGSTALVSILSLLQNTNKCSTIFASSKRTWLEARRP
jgi:chromosome segregation ATPase